MPRLKWNVVHEADTEEGIPTMWSAEINSNTYGKYIWIEGGGIDGFDVIANSSVLKTCKTLASAKRWVSTNL